DVEITLRAGVRPGDEAVKGDRDVSDDSSHARADPIRRPNSSLTHEACGGCELDRTTREAARRTYSGRSPRVPHRRICTGQRAWPRWCPEWPGERLRPRTRSTAGGLGAGRLVADGPWLEDGVHRFRRGHGQPVLGGPADDEAVQRLQFHAAPGDQIVMQG